MGISYEIIWEFNVYNSSSSSSGYISFKLVINISYDNSSAIIGSVLSPFNNSSIIFELLDLKNYY